jgi:hypothetical protein
VNDKLSKYNILVSTFSFLLTLLSNVVLRSYLLNSVGSDYFAVNVILTNTINAFSLFELGVGVTAVFLLYKPIIENDSIKVAALFFYFKKLYFYISLFTGVVSVPLFFFVYKFVSDVVGLFDFLVLYFLYVVNLILVLNCSINKWYLYSKQKIYVFCIIEMMSKLLLFFGQLFFLLYISEPESKYSFFVFAIPCSSLFLFLFLKIYMRKDELLMLAITADLDVISKRKIRRKLKGGINHKVGDVFMNYTDYFIISYFISLSVVTSVSNYLFMTASIVMLITKVFEGVSAKVGHLIASDKNAEKQTMFFSIYISSVFFSLISSVWVYQYSSSFISLWLGSEYLIDANTLLLIVAAMFLQIMRVSSNMMKQSGGIIEVDKHIPIIEALINFPLSIVLTIAYGVNGIFIAKIITGLTLSNWVKAFYIFKHILLIDFIFYIRFYIVTMILSVLSFILLDYIVKVLSFSVNDWFDLIFVSLCLGFLLFIMFCLLFLFRFRKVY